MKHDVRTRWLPGLFSCIAGVLLLSPATDLRAAEPAAVAAVIPDDPAQLRELVLQLDRRMFDAYNAHDVDALMDTFAADLEFFHDTGGLLGKSEVTAGFRNVFANNPDIRRELLLPSVEVYPIRGHGAILVGAHRFCHTENGKPDCGSFRFLHIWRLRDGAWRVSRAVSYGH